MLSDRFRAVRKERFTQKSKRSVIFKQVPAAALEGSLCFQERIRPSHHIFTREGVEEILDLQPKTGGKAKTYQVKQVRQLIIKYRLGGQKRNDR
jgi:hypothetical protein